MTIVVSNASPDPIYEQVARQLRGQIASGALGAGEPLPSIRALARDLGVSVITTKRAYDDLAREGFVDAVPGKGVFVAARNPELLAELRLKAVEDHLERAVAEARTFGIPRATLEEMLAVLYGGEEA